ncbi:PRC-barrel domain-containing protein [Allokutzneria oryzae]|uniref:PRC-barrel domain-containing protein n=1 Tax=Allokutzneria oryzae TaxID=1378989 RepID=A0ABV5ZTK4_9PSEU
MAGCLPPSGNKIGTVEQVWLDDWTGRLEWISVTTGLLGLKQSFLPVKGLRGTQGGDLNSPYAKDHVKNAPPSIPTAGTSTLTRNSAFTATTASTAVTTPTSMPVAAPPVRPPTTR